MDTCRVIEVIETTLLRRGTGTDDSDPIRVITQYWSRDGALLAEVDPFIDENRSVEKLRAFLAKTEPASTPPIAWDRAAEKMP